MAPRGWGFWTEAKLDILSAYLPAFATASKRAGEMIYLDLFAGNTSNERRDLDRDIKGSSVRALDALPPKAHVFLFERPLIADELDRSLRQMFPDRQFEVVPGDCNVMIPGVLERLVDLGVDWAPTFAFVDPYSSAALRWETLEAIAEFKRNKKYKVEQWVLFYGSDIPRVLGQSSANAEQLRRTFGGDLWVPVAEAREADLLTPKEARREYTNLLRWRMENDLGYRYTHSFEVKNTQGSYLYDLVFATDNDAGNRIMGDIYAKAAQRFEEMRHEAIERRRVDRSGQSSLFSPEEVGAMNAHGVPPYEAEKPAPPYGTERTED